MVEIQKQKGFTLIELLVVIGIIGLLASVLLVSVARARTVARDTRRVADLKQLNKALQLYITNGNTPPIPSAYGRANVSPGMWDGWWDLSSNTTSGTFMGFLQTAGIMSQTPVDPLNTPAGNGYPQATGYRYVYYVVPPQYLYQGGACDPNKNVYLLGISDLESEPRPPATKFTDGHCACLWQSAPDFFKDYLDYTICDLF